MPQVERLLSPEGRSRFTREELSWVRFEPWGNRNVFYCTKCRWNVTRSQTGMVVPWDISESAIRDVVEHYRHAHS